MLDVVVSVYEVNLMIVKSDYFKYFPDSKNLKPGETKEK